MAVRRRHFAPKSFRQANTLAFSPLFFQAALAARNLGVLAAVHEANAEGISPHDVASRAGVSLYAARVLLEGCAAVELVTLEAGRYRITDAGRIWLVDEMTNVNANFIQDVCYRGAFHFEAAVKTGTPAGLQVFGGWPTIYAGLTELPAHVQTSWYAFDHFYSDGAFPHALPLVLGPRPKKLLDVGGNTGKWALLCLTQDPEIEVTILDHAGQLARAREAAAVAGVASRLHTHEIDLLDHSRPFPTGFDVIWMSQFLDCFAEADITRLLQRAKAALAPGGRLCVLESFWDRQATDIGEVIVQGLSLYFTCMANGTSRMYHSQDFVDLIASAGLEIVTDESAGGNHTLLTLR